MQSYGLDRSVMSVCVDLCRLACIFFENNRKKVVGKVFICSGVFFGGANGWKGITCKSVCFCISIY